jgi:hypothetical protein
VESPLSFYHILLETPIILLPTHELNHSLPRPEIMAELTFIVFPLVLNIREVKIAYS